MRVYLRTGMSSKSSCLVGSALVLGPLLACTGGESTGATFPDGTIDGADGGGGGQANDPRYSFSPASASRSCGGDSDCAIVTAVRDCSTCCGQGAVARGDAERAYASVVDACKQSGAPPSSACGLFCGETRAACFEGTCVLLATGNTVIEDPSLSCSAPSSPEAGTPAAVPDPGTGPACGARAVRTGFEDGIDPSWPNSDPASFQIDRAEPIAGGASLRIGYRQQNATLTIAQPDACGVRLAFTVRTHLLASGITLARVVAGKGSWFHVRLDGCALSIGEETLSDTAAGFGGAGARWAIPPDVAVRVVLTFDLRAKTITSVVAPVGQPFPAPQTSALRGDPSGAGAIRAIELGSAPGVVSNGVGTVWMDDLVIE